VRQDGFECGGLFLDAAQQVLAEGDPSPLDFRQPDEDYRAGEEPQRLDVQQDEIVFE